MTLKPLRPLLRREPTRNHRAAHPLLRMFARLFHRYQRPILEGQALVMRLLDPARMRVEGAGMCDAAWTPAAHSVAQVMSCDVALVGVATTCKRGAALVIDHRCHQEQQTRNLQLLHLHAILNRPRRYSQ